MSGSDSLIPEAIKLLLVEDTKLVVELTRAYLDEATETSFRLEHAPDLATAKRMVQQYEPDVILLDLGLPDSDGLSTFRTLHRCVPAVPIIIFTGRDDRQLAMEALSLGAKDYLVKANVDSDSLVRSLYYTIERSRIEERLIKSTEELKTATAQLVQSEKLSAMGELAASVAHELNQPLNSIKLTVQSIARYLDDYHEDDLRRDLAEITDTVDKMSKIIDHMRTFSRRSMTVDLVDLNRVLGRTLDFVEEKCQYHNVEFTTSLSEVPAWVRGDPIQLEQIILSLTNNARAALADCAREHRQIELKTYYQPDSQNGGMRVVLEVADNGEGIPEEIKHKIFEPFFTTKAPGKGTGLGLSVAAKIIADHEGTIEVDSRVGVGTRIKVLLPAV